MKMHKKIISVILIIGLIIGNVSMNSIEAKKVEMKIKSSDSKLKITILNGTLDYHLKEVVFKIRNATDNKIKITKIEIQFQSEEQWSSLKKQKSSVTKRKIVVPAGSTSYDSVRLDKDYVIPTDGLAGGKYSLCIKYRYKGNYYCTRKVFSVSGKKLLQVEGTTTETATEIATDDNTNPCPPLNQSTKPTANIKPTTVSKKEGTHNDIAIKIINTDFRIDKNGRASLMVFSEAEYGKGIKSKVYIYVQRRNHGKWRKYKQYKIMKTSNIVFADKQIKIKKRGTYRMAVKIVLYKNETKLKQYKVKSSKRIY